VEPDLDIEGGGDEAVCPPHLAQRIGFVDRQTPGAREMKQKQIVLHQIAAKARFGQFAAGDQKHEPVADVSVPVPRGCCDQTRE
jgi:hypothetical protein